MIIESVKELPVIKFSQDCEHLIEGLKEKERGLFEISNKKTLEFFDLAKGFKTNRNFIQYCFYFAQYNPNVRIALAKTLSEIAIDFFDNVGVSDEFEKYVENIKLFLSGNIDVTTLSADLVYELLDIEEKANKVKNDGFNGPGNYYNQVASYILNLTHKLIIPNCEFDELSYLKLVFSFYDWLDIDTLPDLKKGFGSTFIRNNKSYLVVCSIDEFDKNTSSKLRKLVNLN